MLGVEQLSVCLTETLRNVSSDEGGGKNRDDMKESRLKTLIR